MVKRRIFPRNGSGVAYYAATSFLGLLLVWTSYVPTKPNAAEAFVVPNGRSGMARPSNVRKNTFIALPRASLHLYSIQQYKEEQRQQHNAGQEEDPDDDEKDEAKRLLLDAERLRLEAEQMDATLTLQKIAVLEEKLSNDAWLKKQTGQTVKDLYEDLRQLERKVSAPNSTVRNKDDFFPTREEPPAATALSASTSSSSTSRESDETKFSSTSDRYDDNKKQKNPNLPPMAGFDEKDLNLYVPVAEDVTRMAPNATLDERIALFRDAPELQAHFKEKIQNLLLGPLEEMQELETLKQQYFDSTSSKEKEALLKQIKRLEAKMDENTIGMSVGGGANDPGGIGYSKSILLPPEEVPPLTDDELEERYATMKALPDILVAVYLQRNGLYDLPVPFSTIQLEVGNGGIGVNMNIVNNSATNANKEDGEEIVDDAKQIETNGISEGGDEPSDAKIGASFDLYENLKLAIQLDYYDLQIQLLNQALAIRPMPNELREEYAAAYRSLPIGVRERFVTKNLEIDTLEATVIASDEESDVERVLEEILKPLDEEFSIASLMNLNGQNTNDDGQREQPIVPPEYNDVEFIDRSRFLEEFFPSVSSLEDIRPSPEDVDLFVTDCLTGQGNRPFMVTSKPERVIGGYYVRGTNQFGFDEKNSTTANDRLVQEVYQRLQNHPTLKDKIDFYYILDPSPPTDEEMELEVNLNPLFLVTVKDPQTLYGISSPVTKAAITSSGLFATFLFSVGSCVLNPKINAAIEKSLDSLSSSDSATALIDFQWFFDLCLPLYFSFLGILFAHELGHRIVATYYKVRIQEKMFWPYRLVLIL